MTSIREAHALGPGHPILLGLVLGPGHVILLAVVLAGLGMTAVRQLIAVNADLDATRAELSELAVTAERERLARELHDVLGRTLALIAVKAELAGRLSASADPTVEAEMRDVQGLAREAIRELRDTVMGGHTPSLADELAAAPIVLRTAGITASIDASSGQIDPAHEDLLAWALREAVTNVLKHSGARICRISLQVRDGITMLEVIDDGRGAVGINGGTGLNRLAQRVHAVGGTFEARPNVTGGFRLRVTLDHAEASRSVAEVAG
jgi:two-component system sensor histidine kinase DesK